MSSSSASKTKKFTFKTVLDGLRGSGSSSQNRQDTEIEETLRSEHFNVTKTIRHGFPFQPTALAFDPLQHLLAVGNRTGSLRIIGQAGVDCHCSHESDVSIIQILFLINEGALVTVTNDDHLHLWNFRQKQPSIVHSLKFQREKVSRCHLPFQSKWLYVGTERGNVHMVNIESFTCSGYVINWNKTIELSRKTHPGPVVHLSDNPVDSTKLLIGFESGAIVFWDLRSKSPDYRYNSQEALRSISWHNEGKQFMCSHSDGSLSTWNVKAPQRPASVTSPHAKIGPDGKPDLCKPIAKVEWRSTRAGEAMVVFSGGMSYDRAGRTPSITVMTGKSTTVLEMEHNVVDFVTLCDTPWVNDFQDPYAIVVLLQNDLVVIDLTTPGYPCFENPYPMDLHESPVTACQYYANCPMDIIPALYSTGKNQKKTGFSEKPWPVKGGSWGSSTTSYPEIIITGHADGSLKFWDASSVNLQFLYKLKTAKVFEKPKRPSEDKDDDPFAIQSIFLCPESRIMCVAGPTHCILFKFSKQEVSIDFVTLEFSIVYEVYEEMDSPEFDFSKPSLSVMGQHSSSMGSYSSNASDNAKSETVTSVKAKTGARRWGPGFLPDLVCILCWVDGEPPGNITVMSLNSSYGLLAFGNESGLAIVDYLQKTCLLNLGTPDLYGSMDPYQRAPRSPRSKKYAGEGLVQTSEDCKSPTVDQSVSYLNPSQGVGWGHPSSSAPPSPCGGPGPRPPGLGASQGGPGPPATTTSNTGKSQQQHHQPLMKAKSLTPTKSAPPPITPVQLQQRQGKASLGKALSVGCPESPQVDSRQGFQLAAPKKVPPPRPPSPKPRIVTGSSGKSTEAPSSQREEKRISPEPLNPFEENYFSQEASTGVLSSESNVPKAPPRSRKQLHQKTLVHQPALDLPPSPKRESASPSSIPTSPSAFHSLVVGEGSGALCASPPILTPVICLPRSSSESREISRCQKSSSCENPSYLSPSLPGKPKSVSTGDLPSAEPRRLRSASSSSDTGAKRESATKTFSDPHSRTASREKVSSEAEDPLRKSSSDSQLPASKDEADAACSTEQEELAGHPEASKNWLMKKIHRRSKKKKKKNAEGGEESHDSAAAGEGTTTTTGELGEKAKDGGAVVSSDCDKSGLEDGQQGQEVTGHKEEKEDSDEALCDLEGLESVPGGMGGGRRSPGYNKTFFHRVSLKIKSIGSRKLSNEEEDGKEVSGGGSSSSCAGPLSAHKLLQKSMDRPPRVKIEVLDMTDDGPKKHSMRRMYLTDVLQSRKTVDKVDGSSFSRSRSSSMSSLDNVTKEAIQCLVFADSYTRKSDTETSPCLWVGTSLGSVIVIVLVLQPDQRLSQPVIVSPSGSLYRMKGVIVCMSFLDFKGGLIPALSEQWREVKDNKDSSDRAAAKSTSRQMSVSNSKPKISPTSSTEMNNDRQFAIICSEKQARAISLPSQTCAFKVKVTETSFVVRAEIVGMRESVCLMCYVANGHILAFSLPSLKPLFDADFLPLPDYRVARTFCFSNNGHAMFLCSPTEIQKITYSADISENLNEMLGELFLPRETPEAPKQGLFKTLFGGGVSTLDREELFGEASGKASKGLAKHIPGSGNLQQLQYQAAASGNEFTRTRMLLSERGEKLGDLDDRTAQMMNSAEQFAQAAHGLVNKYKDKKWYQF
ncbi:syntaxin-binding protein 5 isoform X2 [Aplysia californica]|uniref:Syntaxin-binding protein 5 isoform X2 n=1 Tax=Aplysia californica TaxID=6500 RepID=A0ABM0JAQ1_APLCA|nr:syntaxin-binding protein 5 isoform X2 [Aplysia californica]